MSHLLYRPHIHIAEKVVTTDYLITHVKIFRAESHTINLPVDLVNCSTALTSDQDIVMIAPTVFLFSGDETTYVAPALAILDNDAWAINPELAWRLARISVARVAAPLPTDTPMTLNFESDGPYRIDQRRLLGSGRHMAAIRALCAPRQFSAPSTLKMSLIFDIDMAHRLQLERAHKEPVI